MKSEFFFITDKSFLNILTICRFITFRHLSDVQRRIVPKLNLKASWRFVSYNFFMSTAVFPPLSKMFLLDFEIGTKRTSAFPEQSRTIRLYDKFTSCKTKSVTLYIHLLEQNEITFSPARWLLAQVYVQFYCSTSLCSKAFQNAVRIPNANAKRVCRVYRVKIPRQVPFAANYAPVYASRSIYFRLFRGGGANKPYVHVRMHATRGNFEFIPCARAVSTVD